MFWLRWSVDKNYDILFKEYISIFMIECYWNGNSFGVKLRLDVLVDYFAMIWLTTFISMVIFEAVDLYTNVLLFINCYFCIYKEIHGFLFMYKNE